MSLRWEDYIFGEFPCRFRQEPNGNAALTTETVGQAIRDEVVNVEVIDVHTHLLPFSCT